MELTLDNILEACQGQHANDWHRIPSGGDGSDLLVGLVDVAADNEPPALAALTHLHRAVYMPDARVGLGWGMALEDWRDFKDPGRPDWASPEWSETHTSTERLAHVLVNGAMVWRIQYAAINWGAGIDGILPLPQPIHEPASTDVHHRRVGWKTTRYEVEFARLLNNLADNRDFVIDNELRGFGLQVNDRPPLAPGR